jgi:hypothetical protein
VRRCDVRTINLKEGMPRVYEALARLREELKALHPSTRVAKLIHGYGASGVGGAIREAVRRQLEVALGSGEIRYIIPGENWRKVDAATAYWLDVFPVLRGDRDLDKGNPGITIVILSNPPQSGCVLPKVYYPPACLREELEDRKNTGHLVVKVIGPRTAEGPTALRQACRALRSEGSIKHFIPGEHWTTADPETMQWLRKFPQCDGDYDLGSGSQEVSIVFLARKLRGEPYTFAAWDKAVLTPCGRSDHAQLGA